MSLEPDFDSYKSLMQLAPETVEDIFDDGVAAYARRIAAKPLRRLAPAELRFLLTNNLALPYAAPLALQALEGDPFLDTGDYPGDLLVKLLETDSRFWLERHDLWLEGIAILGKAVTRINERMEEEERNDYLPWHIGDDFMGALLHFREIHSE